VYPNKLGSYYNQDRGRGRKGSDNSGARKTETENAEMMFEEKKKEKNEGREAEKIFVQKVIGGAFGKKKGRGSDTVGGTWALPKDLPRVGKKGGPKVRVAKAGRWGDKIDSERKPRPLGKKA